jgi:hypothetical protein
MIVNVWDGERLRKSSLNNLRAEFDHPIWIDLAETNEEDLLKVAEQSISTLTVIARSNRLKSQLDCGSSVKRHDVWLRWPGEECDYKYLWGAQSGDNVIVEAWDHGFLLASAFIFSLRELGARLLL